MGTLVLIAVLGIAWVVYAFNKALDPVESVDQYEEMLSEWRPSGLVGHFPSSVPGAATNVVFSSFPGFLQGGAHIQLRMVLPEAEVHRLYEHATKTANQHQDGGNSVTLVNQRDDGLWSTNPHTLGDEVFVFPVDYRIFIFDAVPAPGAAGHGWNHGESKGMVVSLQRNEVLYFAENW